jgi:hypothetical protein
VIKISQPITPIGLRINPNGIPNLMQSSVSTSFILHPKHYPINPAKRAISNGLRLNIPINTNPKGM